MSNDFDKTSMTDFDEYIRQGEPNRQQKAYNWQTAIGLQAVDGLKTSQYLFETARKHIEGDISIDDARDMLRTYYHSKTSRTPDDDDTEEADRVSANIAKILSTKTLAFNTNGYISTHRQVFEGVFKFAGKIRNYDITKKEWVLRGDTVSYLNYEDLRMALDYDIGKERDFDYSGLTMVEVVAHIAKFVSGLWQIHAFGEGNTRTTAVFTIQYLRSIGFDINNDLFARHSWYFRNALVRANYKNVQRGIMYNYSFIERFFSNLLMGTNYELKNRYMLIDAPLEWTSQQNTTGQVAGQVTGQATGQATGQVSNNLKPSSEFVEKLIQTIGKKELSVRLIMQELGLKGRDNFLNTYLNPGVSEGFVTMLYPNSPRHPRQKYLLTVKGLAIYNERNIKV